MIFSLVSEVEFAAIVDKSDRIDRAKSNSLARFERKEELQLDLRWNLAIALGHRTQGIRTRLAQDSVFSQLVTFWALVRMALLPLRSPMSSESPGTC